MFKDRDLGAWKIFIAVAETGSISRACERLSMDPAHISRTIKALEEDLGNVALFDRSIRPLKLTDNGEVALQSARELIKVHRSLLDCIDRDPTAMRGTIRVAFPPALLQNYLLPFLTDFIRENPEVNLDIHEYNGAAQSTINFDTPRGRLDIVCGYGQDLGHPNTVQIYYGNAPFIPCVSPIYMERHGLPERPEDLIHHTGIIYNSGMRPNIRYLIRNEESVFLRWKHEVYFGSAVTAKNAAVFGVGIHPGIPTLHCYRELQLKQLLPVLPGWRPPSEKLYLYARSESMRLRRVRTFIDAYRATINQLHADCERTLEPIVGPIHLRIR